LSGRAARQKCIRSKQYLQGTHQVVFFASGRSISGDILGVIGNGVSSACLPTQDRQGVVKLVDVSPKSTPFLPALLCSTDLRIPC